MLSQACVTRYHAKRININLVTACQREWIQDRLKSYKRRRKECETKSDNMKAAEVISKSFGRSLLPPALPFFDSYAHLGSPPALPTSSSLGMCHTRQVPDGESSMGEQDFQNLNLPQCFNEPYTTAECISSAERMDTPRIGHSDTPLPIRSSYQVAYNGAPHHWQPSYWPLATMPTVPSPERIPEVDVQTTLDTSIRGNSGDGFRASGDDQIRDNGSRPGWVSELHGKRHPR